MERDYVGEGVVRVYVEGGVFLGRVVGKGFVDLAINE